MTGRQASSTNEGCYNNVSSRQNDNEKISRVIKMIPKRPHLDVNNVSTRGLLPTLSCQDRVKQAQIDSKQYDEETGFIAGNKSNTWGNNGFIVETSNCNDYQRKIPNYQVLQGAFEGVNKRSLPTFANDESASSVQTGFSKHPPIKMENNKNEVLPNNTSEWERKIDEAKKKLNKKTLEKKGYQSNADLNSWSNYKSNGQSSDYFDQKKYPNYQNLQVTIHEANKRTVSISSNDGSVSSAQTGYSKQPSNKMDNRKATASPSVIPELNPKVAEALMKLNKATAEKKGYRLNSESNSWNNYRTNEKGLGRGYDQQKENPNYQSNFEGVNQRILSAPANERLCKKIDALRRESYDDKISNSIEKPNTLENEHHSAQGLNKHENSVNALTTGFRSEEYSNHSRPPTVQDARWTWEVSNQLYSNNRSSPTRSFSFNDISAQIEEVAGPPRFNDFVQNYEALQSLAEEVQETDKLRRPKQDKPRNTPPYELWQNWKKCANRESL